MIKTLVSRVPGWGDTSGVEYLDPSWSAWVLADAGNYMKVISACPSYRLHVFVSLKYIYRTACLKDNISYSVPRGSHKQKRREKNA